MHAQVKLLQVWKEENGPEGCEDAAAYDLSRGLFSVSDGVGTTSFANVWARVLVDHFLKTPLLSTDPFELEWWLRRARQEYERLVPPADQLLDVFRRKANQGSESTFAGMRVVAAQAATAAARVMAIGDACTLIRRDGGSEIESYFLGFDHDIYEHPIVLPTKGFSRLEHQMKSAEVVLSGGDRVILATDAVALWVILAGDPLSRVERFEQIFHCVPADWPAFIQDARSRGMMEDDSTAMVIDLQSDDPPADGFASATDRLGETPAIDSSVSKERQASFNSAVADGDHIVAAIVAGDTSCSGVDSSAIDLPRAQKLGDSYSTLLFGAQRLLADHPDDVRVLYAQFGAGLEDEPAAQPLLATLRRYGVIDEQASEAASHLPSPSSERRSSGGSDRSEEEVARGPSLEIKPSPDVNERESPAADANSVVSHELSSTLGAPDIAAQLTEERRTTKRLRSSLADAQEQLRASQVVANQAASASAAEKGRLHAVIQARNDEIRDLQQKVALSPSSPRPPDPNLGRTHSKWYGRKHVVTLLTVCGIIVLIFAAIMTRILTQPSVQTAHRTSASTAAPREDSPTSTLTTDLDSTTSSTPTTTTTTTIPAPTTTLSAVTEEGLCLGALRPQDASKASLGQLIRVRGSAHLESPPSSPSSLFRLTSAGDPDSFLVELGPLNREKLGVVPATLEGLDICAEGLVKAFPGGLGIHIDAARQFFVP